MYKKWCVLFCFKAWLCISYRALFWALCSSLYIFHLSAKLFSYGIHFHCYADDTQLYVPIKADDKSQIRKLETCLYVVKKWM